MLTREENIKKELCEKFPYLAEKIVIQRQRRIWVEVTDAQRAEVFDYLVKKMKFAILSAMTGLDEGESLAVIYHLSQEGSVFVNLRARLPKENPTLASVTSYFPNADIYERELVDLLGIKVTGLAEGQRYPLPETWPRDKHPLRKECSTAIKPPEGGKPDA